MVTKFEQLKKLKCRERSQLCKLSKLCYHFLSRFENENENLRKTQTTQTQTMQLYGPKKCTFCSTSGHKTLFYRDKLKTLFQMTYIIGMVRPYNLLDPQDLEIQEKCMYVCIYVAMFPSLLYQPRLTKVNQSEPK